MNVTVDLPDHLVAQLETAATEVGVTKSTIVKLALHRAIPQIREFLFSGSYPPPLLTTSPPPNALKILKPTLQEGGDCQGEGGLVSDNKPEEAYKPPPEPKPKAPTVTIAQVRDLVEVWNQNCGTLPKCGRLTEGRERKAKTRLGRRPDLDEWTQGIRHLAASDFVSSGKWCNFGWILKNDEHITDALEGKFANKRKVPGSKVPPRRIVSPEEHALRQAEIAKVLAERNNAAFAE